MAYIPHPRGLSPRQAQAAPEPVYVTVADRLDTVMTVADAAALLDRPVIILRRGVTLRDYAPTALDAVASGALRPGHIRFWAEAHHANPMDLWDGSYPAAGIARATPDLVLPQLRIPQTGFQLAG